MAAPASIPGIRFETTPIEIDCPNCKQRIKTQIYSHPTVPTHVIALATCLICCCLVWVPYVIPSCNEIIHSCPRCHTDIGIYRPFS